MKRTAPKKNGMETVTSMVLLLVSALLIFNVFTLLDIGHDNVSPLLELRTYQARSLGETLVQYSNNSMDPSDLNDPSHSSEVMFFFWDGSSFIKNNSDNSSCNTHVKKVLETTPDGLSVLVVLDSDIGLDLKISGEYVTWSYTTTDGSFISLFLSIHIGSIQLIGGEL